MVVVSDYGSRAWPFGTRCVGCSLRAVQRHHAVYEQEVRREGGSVKDDRNLVPVCKRCHERHHQRVVPLESYRLPDAVFEFARELLGAGAAYEYLRRRYAGSDPRLESLLLEAADV